MSPYIRFAGTAAATLVAICAAGAYPTSRLSGADGLVAMGIAGGVSFVGACLGFLPSALAPSRYESRVQAAMLGIVVRLFVTLAAVLAVLASGAAAARTAFVAWIGIDYAAMLALETVVVLRAVRRPEAPPGQEGPASA